MRVALEVEHGVDDVLEHARPRDRALLGDVADDEQRAAAVLRLARELRGALAHLRDRAGRRLQRLGPEGLDRVHHRDLRFVRVHRRGNALELDFRNQVDGARVEGESPRPHCNLLGRFLARDV